MEPPPTLSAVQIELMRQKFELELNESFISSEWMSEAFDKPIMPSDLAEWEESFIREE